ncbi:EAL domain-containing protein [Lysinibacillus antri]|uniref:EAL domain-containing protein n=2 Tax=Lysinibacillus antri TaxID=2498145 RepID=A0A3S0R6Z8_9BACI|nr:EAL domain-containing protein [Lysinibacillus antri]
MYIKEVAFPMFTLPDLNNIFLLEGHYSAFLVILSIIISCYASYIALSMNRRMKDHTFFHKNFWLFLSSIAMGLGIWSMHFIGMSAFMLPIPMSYDVGLTIVSALPAILASYTAFYFSNQAKPTHKLNILSGIIMGIGISAMHYVGMAAMEMEAAYTYKTWMFVLSILIAITVSYTALYIFTTLQKHMDNQLIKMITSIIMGLAITSMHYTGMAAVVFYVNEPLPNQLHHMDMTFLIIVITVGIFFLLTITGLTSLLDRYVNYRLNFFDALTLYPNQRLFEKDLYNVKTSGSLAIIHIHDLEKWTNVHGYAFGDKIIKTVGTSLSTIKPISSKVSHIERNRFAILNSEKNEYENMKLSIKQILADLQNPFLIDDHSILVEMVCTISHTSDKKELSELFFNNLAVLHHPLIQYTHEVIEFDPSIHTYGFERKIIDDIDQAIKKNELFLVYQPKVCSKALNVTGVEALLRWQHPIYGFVSPGLFIPILEKSDKIFDVTDWVIEEVSRQISIWVKDNVPFSHVSINIPGTYVTSTRLLNVLKQNLLTHKINSSSIELEITETSVIHNMENAIASVNEFRNLGFTVALDDFGTGLSSLSYLRRIPISTIKIDKSFVKDITHSSKDSEILKAIITLCNSLNLKIVIEGVETEEQVNIITELTETPQIQGYYFSKPLVAEELVSWIKQENLKS